MTLIIIGGASGVGKTSLLQKLDLKTRRVNTGTLFKKHMILDKRDDVRKGDWSVYQQEVINDLICFISCPLQNSKDIIIDTHFAAKIYNKNYRIGLRENYLFDFGLSLSSKEIESIMLVQIILITVNPYILLNRRRLDKTREREITPSDCYNDLRSNNIYSIRYKGEISRAFQKSGCADKREIRYCCIENNDFETSLINLKNILKEKK